MSDIAIRVDGLGKAYRIGTREDVPASTLAGMRRLASSPFAYLKRMMRPPTEAEIYWALRDVSFEIRQGEVVGVIGRNGAGKSTLLKILSRITEPSCGRAEVHGRVGSLLEVGTGFHPELTGRENIYLNGAILGMRRNEIDRRFDEIVAFAEIDRFLDTAVKRYSSGMYVRLAFAVAAHLQTGILLVDEVLAVGDSEFQKKCLGKMEDIATEGRTILFVSHNMVAVQQLCQHGLFLAGGEVNSFGPLQRVMRSYMQRVESAVRTTELARRTDRKGSQWLRFTKVLICDDDNHELNLILCGQDVNIRIYYQSDHVVNDATVNIAFNVRTSRGSLLANLNSVDVGHAIHDLHTNGYFECHWPRFQFRSGQYQCDLFCSVNGEIVDWLEGAFFINVEDGNFYGTGKLIERIQGDVLVDHHWRSGQTTSEAAITAGDHEAELQVAN